MLEIVGEFKVYKIVGADEELTKTLREHSENHCFFDKHICYEDLEGKVESEKKYREENKDKEFIKHASKLLKFMKEKKIKRVFLEGLHY